MTVPLKIIYELVGTGWSKCMVEVGERRAELSASYLSDALGNLVLFACAAGSGFHSVSFGFDEEPGEYRWVAESIDANLLLVRILEFPDLWGHKPNTEGKVLLEFQIAPRLLAQAVFATANEVLQKYGSKGYAEKWALHSFPERELAMLKTAIDGWQQ
ncbi:hypothetical protein [Undibacterium danionis]|uniref:DUF4304 domain-containing protein n=1 Tax=Undibacterium danionis TaxID=1812100 RepID=A0ABV6IFM1_9BURK